MRHFKLGWLAIGLVWCAACSRPPKPPDAAALEASASAKLQNIPAADAEKYRNLKGMKNWRNPYLTVLPEGIGLLDPADSEQKLLKPEEVLPALAAMPASAWPYGRVVALVEDPGSTTQEQHMAILRNKGIVAGTLEQAHVAIQFVPSE